MADNTAEQQKTQALWQAYRETLYFNDHLSLRVGKKAPEMEPADTVVLWLTAENPHSQVCSSKANQAANRRLAERMGKYLESAKPRSGADTKAVPRVEEAIAKHPNGQWPAEQGFFVYLPADLWREGQDFWETLASEFGQNAIVVAEPGKPVQLLVTDHAFRRQLEAASGQHL